MPEWELSIVSARLLSKQARPCCAAGPLASARSLRRILSSKYRSCLQISCSVCCTALSNEMLPSNCQPRSLRSAAPCCRRMLCMGFKSAQFCSSASGSACAGAPSCAIKRELRSRHFQCQMNRPSVHLRLLTMRCYARILWRSTQASAASTICTMRKDGRWLRLAVAGI